MKKILVISLITLFAFNSLFFYCSYWVADYAVYYKNQKSIEKKNLSTLLLSKNDWNKCIASAERKNEISYNGKMYDVASFKINDEGKVIVICYEDKEDLLLLSYMAEKSKDDASSSKNKSNCNFNLLHLFVNDISPYNFSFDPVNEYEIIYIAPCYAMHRAAPLAPPPCI